MTSSPVNKLSEQFVALSVDSKVDASQGAKELAQKVASLLLRPDEEVAAMLVSFPEAVQMQIHAVQKEAKTRVLDMATTQLLPKTDEMVLRAKVEELSRTVCGNKDELLRVFKNLDDSQKIDLLTAAAPLLSECRSVMAQNMVLKFVKAIESDKRAQSLQHYPVILKSYANSEIQLQFISSLLVMMQGEMAGLVAEGLGNIIIQTPSISWGDFAFRVASNPLNWIKKVQAALPFLQNPRLCEHYYVREIVEIVDKVAYSDNTKLHASGLMEYVRYASDIEDVFKFLEGVLEEDRAVAVQNCKRILAPIIPPEYELKEAIAVLKSEVAEEYLSLADLMPRGSSTSLIKALKGTLEKAPPQKRKEVRDTLAYKVQSGMHGNDLEKYCSDMRTNLMLSRDISDAALLEERNLTNLLCIGLTLEEQKCIKEGIASIRFVIRLDALRNTALLTTRASSFTLKMLLLATFANIIDKPVNLQELLEDFYPLISLKNEDSYPKNLNELAKLSRDQRKEFVAHFLAEQKESVVQPRKKDPSLHV